MRFLDRIVGGVALVTHACVVMTLTLASDDMDYVMSKLSSVNIKPSQISSKDSNVRL